MTNNTTTSSSEDGSCTAKNAATTTAYDDIVVALLQDMPLIQHGSGDVVPSQTNRDTTQLLAQLTARYISNLVEAAVDSQEILNDGHRPPLPPPPPPTNKRQPSLPTKYDASSAAAFFAAPAATSKENHLNHSRYLVRRSHRCYCCSYDTTEE